MKIGAAGVVIAKTVFLFVLNPVVLIAQEPYATSNLLRMASQGYSLGKRKIAAYDNSAELLGIAKTGTT